MVVAQSEGNFSARFCSKFQLDSVRFFPIVLFLLLLSYVGFCPIMLDEANFAFHWSAELGRRSYPPNVTQPQNNQKNLLSFQKKICFCIELHLLTHYSTLRSYSKYWVARYAWNYLDVLFISCRKHENKSVEEGVTKSKQKVANSNFK